VVEAVEVVEEEGVDVVTEETEVVAAPAIVGAAPRRR
jgi:hypothetical protein